MAGPCGLTLGSRCRLAFAAERCGPEAQDRRCCGDADRRSAIVGITGGTTTIAVARALASVRKLTVVTNALNVGMELARHRNIRLVLTGGVCRTASFELSGPIAESTLSGYNLDVAFIGVDGIDADAGCTTHDDSEARANAALVKIARTPSSSPTVPRSAVSPSRASARSTLSTSSSLTTRQIHKLFRGSRPPGFASCSRNSAETSLKLRTTRSPGP